MDRFWLLTWTTYGSWLPGDDRGYVSNVRDGAGARVRHDIPETMPDGKDRGLQLAAQEQMKGERVYLSHQQAEILLAQFQETSRYRGWSMLAVAIIHNHIHLLVGVPGDPEPEVLLRDFKSYGSRALNRKYGKPASGTWWTTGGSTRKKSGAEIESSVEYIRNQHNPLVVFIKSGEPGASALGV